MFQYDGLETIVHPTPTPPEVGELEWNLDHLLLSQEAPDTPPLNRSLSLTWESQRRDVEQREHKDRGVQPWHWSIYHGTLLQRSDYVQSGGKEEKSPFPL